MCDLKQLSNGLWVAALGTPQAIVVSRDLKTWYPLYVEGFDEHFNHYMQVSVGEEFIACSTGRSLLVFGKDEVYNALNKSEPVMVTYNALISRLKGLGFTLKHRFRGI